MKNQPLQEGVTLVLLAPFPGAKGPEQACAPGPGLPLNPRHPALLRDALLTCTLRRLADAFAPEPAVDRVLCVDFDRLSALGVAADRYQTNIDDKGRYIINSGSSASDALDFLPRDADAWEVFPQAPEPPGERLSLAWQVLGGGRVIFLGLATPDLPAPHLRSIIPALDRADAVLGRAGEECWVLAANRFHPDFLRGIDWAAGNGYHQALAAARNAGLRTAELEPWHPADSPEACRLLHTRLDHATDPNLRLLRDRLHVIYM